MYLITAGVYLVLVIVRTRLEAINPKFASVVIKDFRFEDNDKDKPHN